MVYIRGTIAALIGALVMIVTSQAMGNRMFAEGSLAFEPRSTLTTTIVLGLGAAVGGFLCTLIVGSANSPAIYVAIGLMLAVTGRSFALDRAAYPDWYWLFSVIGLAVGFLIGASAAAYKLDRR